MFSANVNKALHSSPRSLLFIIFENVSVPSARGVAGRMLAELGACLHWGITQGVIRVSKNIPFHSLSIPPGAKPGSSATEQTPLLNSKAEELNLSSDNCACLTGGQRRRKFVHNWMGEVESPEGKKCLRDEPLMITGWKLQPGLLDSQAVPGKISSSTSKPRN